MQVFRFPQISHWRCLYLFVSSSTRKILQFTQFVSAHLFAKLISRPLLVLVSTDVPLRVSGPLAKGHCRESIASSALLCSLGACSWLFLAHCRLPLSRCHCINLLAIRAAVCKLNYGSQRTMANDDAEMASMWPLVLLFRSSLGDGRSQGDRNRWRRAMQVLCLALSVPAIAEAFTRKMAPSAQTPFAKRRDTERKKSGQRIQQRMCLCFAIAIFAAHFYARQSS